MKIGFSYDPGSKGFPRYGNKRFQKIAQCGFSAIDYNMANTDTDIYTCSISELREKMLQEKAEITAAGLEVSQVHGPWRWPPQDGTAADRAEWLAKMKRSLDATALLDCKNWVIHPIMPFGMEERQTADEEKTWELNRTFMSALLAYAKELGITVCLENMPMPDFSMGSPADVLRFVRQINDPNFRICLDTGHVAIFPGLCAGDVLRQLGSYVRVLHIHDNMGDRDFHLWPGQGRIDWQDLAKALDEVGFTGVFSLETAPSEALEDAQWEAECKKLCAIARNIIAGKTA